MKKSRQITLLTGHNKSSMQKTYMKPLLIILFMMIGNNVFAYSKIAKTNVNETICKRDGFTNLENINQSDYNTSQTKFRTVRLDLSAVHNNTNGNYVSIILHNLTTGSVSWSRNRIQTLAKSVGKQIRDNSSTDMDITKVGSLVSSSDNLYEYTFSSDMEIYDVDKNVDKSMVWLKLDGVQPPPDNMENQEWVIVDDNFDKSMPFKKIRVLNKQSSKGDYCCLFFSTQPNDNSNKDTRYNVNFFYRTIGDNQTQPYGTSISSCKDVGNNWYEYEFKNASVVYYSHYQVNCPRNQVMALINKPQDDSEIIKFADNLVKKLCLSKWDKNSDGELSQNEAESIESLDNTFAETNITSFDELQYFTGLTYIGNNDFYNCGKLRSIVIPCNVKSIEDGAFNKCSNLSKINIPDGVIYLGNSTFAGCISLTAITIPSSVISIDALTFVGCSGLNNIRVSSENEKYDSRDNCNAIIESASNVLIYGCKNSIVPSGVTSIGKQAFYRCSNLFSILIPASVTSIGQLAFSDCTGLTSVTFSSGITIIGSSAFQNCLSLTSITLPGSVTTIEKGAFANCTSLTTVTIPASVSTIADYSFTGCVSLVEVVNKRQKPQVITDYVFGGCYCKLHVPPSSGSLYKAATGWKNFTIIEDATDDMKEVKAVERESISISAILTPDGKHLTSCRPGLNILYMSDGTTRKIIVK